MSPYTAVHTTAEQEFKNQYAKVFRYAVLAAIVDDQQPVGDAASGGLSCFQSKHPARGLCRLHGVGVYRLDLCLELENASSP